VFPSFIKCFLTPAQTRTTFSTGFFFILVFFKKNREMNSAETYFQVLALSSRASLVDVNDSSARRVPGC
jgi:uncharacterized membrane protein YobD (UPF0266 family)